MLVINEIINVGREPDDYPDYANYCAYRRDGRWYLLESWGDYYWLGEVEPESDEEEESLVRVTRYRHGPSAN